MEVVLGFAIWLLLGLLVWKSVAAAVRFLKRKSGTMQTIWSKTTNTVGISLKSGSSADEISDAVSLIVTRAHAEDPETSSVVRVRAEDPWVLITYTWDAEHTGETGTQPAIRDDGDGPGTSEIQPIRATRAPTGYTPPRSRR